MGDHPGEGEVTPYEQQLQSERQSRLARFSVAAKINHFEIRPVERPRFTATISREQFAEAHRIIDTGAIVNRMDIIQRAVAAKFNVTIYDLKSIRQGRPIVVPRQLAMFLCKEMTAKSLPEIGRGFGGRHHTTVMHALSRVQEAIQKDPEFAKLVDGLRETLG
jgi:chromosomal replication initiation ATPase DnaA